MFEKVTRNQELEVWFPRLPKAGKVKDVPKIRLLTNEIIGAYPSLAVWKSKTKNSQNSKNEHGGTMAGEGDP